MSLTDAEQVQRHRFLEVLSDCGSVPHARRSADIYRRTLYQWLESDPSFAAEVDAAKRDAAGALEIEARRRAVDGVDKPVGWYKGEAGGMVREYSDTLLIFLLKGAMPEKYQDRIEFRGALASIDMTQLSAEALERIGGGEHPMAVLASEVQKGAALGALAGRDVSSVTAGNPATQV